MLTELSNLGEYGLLGLIVGALFTIVSLLIKALIKHLEKMHNDHKNERSEWRHSEDKRSEQLNQSMKELVLELRRRG